MSTITQNNLISPPPSAVPLVAVAVICAAAAALATYLVLQIINNGHLLSLSGVNVSPRDLTIYCTATAYSVSAVLALAAAVMLKNYCQAHSCCEGLSFLVRFITNPSQVGAIAPSSHALAVQITNPIPDRSKLISLEAAGMRFLEIGAGTGVFTTEIVKKLGPDDLLDVVEYDHTFCEQLRAEFGHNPNVHIHEVSITDFEAAPYDIIVSGLPLNAFGPEFVAQVLKKYEDLSKPGTTVSYFEYIEGIAKLKKRGDFLGC